MKKRSQYRITSIVKELCKIISFAQEKASLITKQGVVKKEMRICFNIRATQTKWIRNILKTIFEFMLTQMT